MSKWFHWHKWEEKQGMAIWQKRPGDQQHLIPVNRLKCTVPGCGKEKFVVLKR